MIPAPRLACEQCKRRKIRCNKGSPCLACKNADLQCHTVQRARLPRGKSSKSRAHNSQLEDRVARIESLLVQQLQTTSYPISVSSNNQAVSTATSTLPQVQLTDTAPAYLSTVATPMASFVAPEFWTALSEEVQGLRETIEDSEDELGNLTSCDGTANDTSNTCAMLFPQTRTQTVGIASSPPSSARLELLEHFKSRVDSVYKILHWPTVSSMTLQCRSTEACPVADAELLEYSIYFMAICSMTNEEAKAMGLGERIEALQAYRSTVEALFTKSCLLTSPTLVALQAFVIYLIGLRTCLSGAYTWTLVAVAVRAATALHLGEESTTTHTTFDIELRRRLLFSIGILDTHSALDRGTRPMLPSTAFRNPPLNINDQDMSPPNNVPSASSLGSTDMSHTAMTYEAMICQRKIYELSENTQEPWKIWSQKVALVDEFGRYVESVSAMINVSSGPTERLLKISGEKIFVSLQLILRRPPYRQLQDAVPPWDDFDILDAGCKVLEQHMQPMPPELQRWAWKNWVQWHALAVVLAELTIRPVGPLPDRAYAIATESFAYYAKVVADSESGMLWRPIARLFRRVQKIRQHVCTESQVGRIDTLSADHGQDMDMFDFTHCDLDNHDFEVFANHDITVQNQGDNIGYEDEGEPWLAWNSFLQDIILP